MSEERLPTCLTPCFYVESPSTLTCLLQRSCQPTGHPTSSGHPATAPFLPPGSFYDLHLLSTSHMHHLCWVTWAKISKT